MGNLNLAQLRHDIRAARRAVSPTVRRRISADTAAAIYRWLQDRPALRHIATFLSLPEEIDTAPLNRLLWQNGYHLYLPYVKGKSLPLAWYPYTENTLLTPDTARIPAPDPAAAPAIAALELDAVITPLVAHDAHGTRLGMGGGFYDRTFQRKIPHAKPWLIGIAYPCQAVTQTLPRRPWDIPLDALASAHNLHTYEQEKS